MSISKPTKKLGIAAGAYSSTLALSDLHMGRVITHARSPEVLAPLVEGFERVLLLGDIVDHWYTSAEQARDYEHRIRKVCKAAGVRDVVYFRGNHDACQEDGEEFALLDGVLYLHGHAVYHKLKGEGEASERIQELNAKKFGPARMESRANHPGWEFVERVYGKIPMQLMIPFKFPFHVRKRIKALAEEIAPAGAVRAVVLGHSHRPGVKHYGGMTLFNLGGWITNTRAYGFARRGSQAQMIRIDTRADRMCGGKVLHECAL